LGLQAALEELRMFRVRRHPFLYIVSLVAVLFAHAWLCYPAATSRGYPPIPPFWQYIAIFIGFLGVAIGPDLGGFRGLRNTAPSFARIVRGGGLSDSWRRPCEP
jgi:hypothetical protein